ncbi:MAG: pitrilysin family protein [Candidatus Aminicenantaceae bacterium]
MRKIIILFTVVVFGCGLLSISCARRNPDRLSTELLPVEGSPLVGFRIMLHFGSAHDPEGQEGIGALMLSMLAAAGSRSMTFQEITQAFYPMAAGVGLQMDKEMATITGTIHMDNLEPYYAIFKTMLLEPGFREEDFIRLKTNQLDFLEKTLVGNLDEQFGKEILNNMMYEGHPYGHNENGTLESVRGLSLADVKDYYTKRFQQGNITIGLVGGYPADLPDRVREDFAVLPEGHVPQLMLPAQRKPEGLEIVVADKQTPATAISMGFPVSLSRADDDFFALWIAGSYFGEHRQHLSHLFQKIREERGQNYGDYAYIEHFIQGRDKFPDTNYCRQQQYFSIWIRPLANSNRHFVLRQALRELKILVDEGIPEERFLLTRQYLLNYTRLYAQTLQERLGWQMDSQYYGHDDFLAEAQERLAAVTLEEVNAAIRKHLNYENLYIAVITQNAQTFQEVLVANTPSPITYANPNMPKEILDEDLLIQGFPLDVIPEKVRVVPASGFFLGKGIPEVRK